MFNVKHLTLTDAAQVERVDFILRRDYSLTLTQDGADEAFRWTRQGGSPRQAAELIRSDIDKARFVQPA